MSIGKIDDFDTDRVGPIKGAHAQQLVRALRILDNDEGYNTAQEQPAWDFAELFPAVVVGHHHAVNGKVLGDLRPGMYWVAKSYIGSGLTADQTIFYNATDDANLYYPAINVLEMMDATNAVRMGQPVLVIAMIDRGIANRKRYLFIADRPLAWIKITSAIPSASMGSITGGGGYYNARSITGAPVTIDPTTDLVAPCDPKEVVAATDDILAENWAESNLGDPGSHWVPPNTFVPAWLVGYSNETPPRPVYRFYSPGRLIAIITDIINSEFSDYGGGATLTQPLGQGRYWAEVSTGGVVNVDVTTDFNNLTAPDPGWNPVGTQPLAGVPGQVIFCNLWEMTPIATGTKFGILGAGRVPSCTAVFVGMTTITPLGGGPAALIPVYYGWACDTMFPVTLYNATSTPGPFPGSRPIWAYDMKDVAVGAVIRTAVNPWNWPANAVGGSAVWGIAIMSPSLGPQLYFAFEDELVGGNGTFMDVTLATFTYINGRIQFPP